MSYKGFNNTAFARASATTLAKHITKVEEAMLRNYQMLAVLQRAGRVSRNNAGEGFDWPVQYRLHRVEGNTGETPRSFERTNLWKTASLEYRGYQATDAMYRKEFRSNRGQQAIVNVFRNFTTRLETSLKQAFGREIYKDGNAAGNEETWHGIESFGAYNGTINISTGAQRSANAADKVAYPSDTYAGLSTVLGNYGGTQESGVPWPQGTADAQYDFWSPLIVNYNSTSFGSVSTTGAWSLNGDEAMRYGIVHAQRNSTMDGQITNIWLDRNLWIDLLNLLDDKEEIQVTSQNSLRALGFTNVLTFDGVEVSWEAGVPSDTGYGLNYNTVELMCMDPNLLESEGPEYDIFTQAFVAVVGTLSNFKFACPRNCLFLKAVTAEDLTE